MYVEMEQHSALISLNMSPFQLSPQGSPQGAPQQSAPGPANYASSQYSSPGAIANNHHQNMPNNNYNSEQQQQAGNNQFFDATSLEERCPMCGDKMSGFQYGLLTCESCKGFFKRNNSPCSYRKVYTCLFSPTGGAATSLSNLDQQQGYNQQPVAASAGQQGQQNGPSQNAPAAAGGQASNGQGLAQVQGAICHPSLGQVGVVTGSIPGPSDFPDTKDLIEELCPVCGDKVSGYHYGLLTCESCKGFFKRTVQNKKVYTCVAERSCHIDKTQRKRCPFCRFQKCLEVGMKLEAVRADRMRGGRNKFGPMYKRDRARKLQLLRQRQLALQTIRGSLSDPSNYPSTVTPFLHIKQEIQIPQVSSLTSSPDSSPSPAAVGLVSSQQQSSSGGAGQQHLIAPSSASGTAIVGVAAAAAAAAAAGNHLHNNNPSSNSNPVLDQKLWAANSTTSSSPKGSAFAFGEQSSGHHAGHHNNAAGGAATMPASQPSSNMPTTGVAQKTSPIIRDFLQTVDDREWQASLFGLLQNQTYNQCEVDLFELMCKVLDQNLFSQVDWARNSVFFKDLKVDDQMKLLQHSWSDMLVLDHLHQRLHNNLPDETTLHNGQKFDLLCLGLLGVPSLSDLFNDLSSKLQDLKFDLAEYICMKFLMLLNHETRGLSNKKHVQEAHEQVQQALLDYSLSIYPSVPDKFNRLLGVLPEIHVVASRGEDHLYQKHCNGGAPTQTLLMEMLHAKRK